MSGKPEKVPATQKTTIEDVTHSKDEDCIPRQQPVETEDILEQGFFFLDEGSDESDEESDLEDEVDEDELLELQSEAKIHRFNSILAEVQKIAMQAEKEAAGLKPKRKRYYTGNAPRTIRRHALKRRQIEATGQKFINSWFLKAEETDQPTEHICPVGGDESEEEEFAEPEIEERVNHLFSTQNQIHVS